MNVEYYTPKEMEDLIDKNEITDAKTIAAFEKARKYLPGL
jgi:ADP-ribose pyrophosphatase